jgi:hypothetical protein
MTTDRTTAELRALDRDEAIDKALLYVLQLSGKDYRKMQTALTPVALVRALEQDGYTVVSLDRLARAEAVVEAAQAETVAFRGLGPMEFRVAHGRLVDALAAHDTETGLHFHDAGDASYEDIRAGRYTCIDPDCPDHAAHDSGVDGRDDPADRLDIATLLIRDSGVGS